MITYLIFGLLFVLLIVFSILTAKNWHWSQIVILCLIYLVGVAAVFGAASTLAKRRDALIEVKKSSEELDTLTEQLTRQRFGDPENIRYSADSLYGVEEALKLELAGRGRVWMNGQVADANGNRKFTFPVSREAGNPDIGALQNAVVFAFLDEQFGELTYPGKFVGTFRVANETADSLELEPRLLLNDEIYQLPGTWTLYEKMPSDQYQIFSRQKEDGTGELSLDEFRAKLETELPPELVGMEPGSADYEAFIDQFLFDGRSIGEIENWLETAENRISRVFTPDPDEVFVKYRFDRKSSRSYKVDAQGNLETDGGYNFLGEAIDPALHLGPPDVEFGPDDEVLIDLPSATGYQRVDGSRVPAFPQVESVTELDRIYKRQLYDFPAMFADLRRQSAALDARTAEMIRQNEIQEQAFNNMSSQIALRQEQIQKIQQDNENLQKDVEAINALLQQRTEEVALIRQELNDLERKLNAQRSGRDGKPLPAP